MTMEHLSRTLLERYAHGHVLGAEAHAVELHLERCELCREAVEGLAATRAPLPELRRPMENGRGASWLRPVVVVGVVALISVLPWLLPSHDDEALLTTGNIDGGKTGEAPETLADNTPNAIQLPTEKEITTAVQILPSQQIGHEPAMSKPPLKTDEVVVQRDTVTIEEVPVRVERPKPVDTMRVSTPTAVLDSRELVFLHNLKLVHPNELYGHDAPPISGLGVSAQFASPEDQAAAEPETRPVQYLDQFDVALAAFSRNDHKRALTELRTVLAQYPDDINALFYAGLSCYNLGLYKKAERYFARAAIHPVGTFDQEALWYQALSTERSEGIPVARPLFVVIAGGGGFYAEQAFEKVQGR